MLPEIRSQRGRGPKTTEMPTGIIQSDCNHFYLTNRETEALARLRPKESTVSQILEQL